MSLRPEKRNMVIEDFAEVSHSRTVETLRSAAERFAHSFECDKFGIQLVSANRDGSPRFAGVDNVTAAYMEMYEDLDRGRKDPVMQHARHSHLPLLWGRETYASAGTGDKWEEQDYHGYSNGFIVASHLPNNKHVVVGIERKKPFTGTPEALTRMLAQFQLFATYAIDPAMAVLDVEPEPELECPLSGREKECLAWTIAGKTAWEIGQILSISERTVAQHIGAAARKLDSVNKFQAALKALRLGWISG